MPEPQILMTGIALGESPRWHDGRLWFSDWAAQEVIALDVEGNSEVIVRDVPSMPFCLDWLPDGRLLIVSGREGRLMRREAGDSLVTHADLRALAATPWNEIVVDGRGNAYLNNTGFDFPFAEFAPGTIALVTPDGAVRPVADGLAFPNGMVVTPDNSTLVVAESYANRLAAFDIAVDGSLANRRVWADLGEGAAPDGICLDAENAVWYADVPNRRCVRVHEGGELLQTIDLDRGGFACMLGGTDEPSLYVVTAHWPGAAGLATHTDWDGQVVRVPVDVPGAGWPAR